MCTLQMPPKGQIVLYDPENCDESFAPEYGGYTFGDGGGGGRGGGRGGPRLVEYFTCMFWVGSVLIITIIVYYA